MENTERMEARPSHRGDLVIHRIFTFRVTDQRGFNGDAAGAGHMRDRGAPGSRCGHSDHWSDVCRLFSESFSGVEAVMTTGQRGQDESRESTYDVMKQFAYTGR
jgi:hypothetical protein